MECFFHFIAALRGAATLKARALKEVWNIAAVLPAEKTASVGFCTKGSNGSHSNRNNSGELAPEDFLTACSQELLAKGSELLKRTRKGIESGLFRIITHLFLSMNMNYAIYMNHNYTFLQVIFTGNLSRFI